MSDNIKVDDLVDSILNPKDTKLVQEQENIIWNEFSLKQEVLPEGSAIVEEEINEINIIDLNGKHFKFPGTFIMVQDGNRITFKAVR
tara:strand:- start:262 stop:522 length:261 start_codon:yes stop_codon:yes gene_type:complete